ncbi:hypothetical protein ACXIZN_16095 [Amycolatopsis sp. TRM77291]
MSIDLDDLVDRAKLGLLHKREIAEVVRELQSTDDEERTYRLLYIVGRSSATEHEDLVASFLTGGDPELARLALQTLCTFWGLTETYLDSIRIFLRGVSWDHIGEVRHVAASIAGEYLRDHADTGLLTRLIELAHPGNDDPVERRIVLEALARALGDPIQETLRAGGKDRESWSAQVLTRAENRLATE